MKPVTRKLCILLACLLPLTALADRPAQPAVSVIVAAAQPAGIADPIEALGTLAANESVSLTATVTETVSAIHFDDGDRVKQGQVLVEMTDREEHAQLEEARATVNEALRQYRRIRSLEAQGTAAKSLLDERRREWETATARLAAIESRLADRLIKAPFAGVLGLRDISTGALVQPGDRITTLDDDSVMKLEFQVPGTLLDKLQPGLKVVARADAWRDRVFEGEVKSINSRIDPVTRAVRVRAILPNDEQLLKPGMLLRVVLQIDPRTALTIPEEALIAHGKSHSVYVVDPGDDSKVEKREIRIGARQPGRVEVLEGLAAGERVVSHGALKLAGNKAIRIVAVDDGSRPLADMLRELKAADTPE